jgi:hypothetical protein
MASPAYKHFMKYTNRLKVIRGIQTDIRTERLVILQSLLSFFNKRRLKKGNIRRDYMENCEHFRFFVKKFLVDGVEW